MKKHLIVLTLILALTLTACSNGGTSPDTATTPESQTSAENTAETSAPETEAETTGTETAAEETETPADAAENAVAKEDYPDYLYGPGGDKVSPEEITEISCYSDEAKWSYAECEGFTYIAEPTGISFNMAENPDLFDSENFVFKGAPESSAEYKRYSVGDSICGLTVKEAASSFANQPSAAESHNERYFMGGSVTFDGSVELSGYIVILSEDEYAVGGEGDIVFIPDSASQTLPVMNYNRISEEKGVYSSLPEYGRGVAGFAYQSEYPFIACGNIENYDSTMFSAVEHNSPTHVRITAENISMSSTVEWFPNINITVGEMELL